MNSKNLRLYKEEHDYSYTSGAYYDKRNIMTSYGL